MFSVARCTLHQGWRCGDGVLGRLQLCGFAASQLKGVVDGVCQGLRACTHICCISRPDASL
jgi:hypothetical protein